MQGVLTFHMLCMQCDLKVTFTQSIVLVSYSVTLATITTAANVAVATVTMAVAVAMATFTGSPITAATVVAAVPVVGATSLLLPPLLLWASLPALWALSALSTSSQASFSTVHGFGEW